MRLIYVAGPLTPRGRESNGALEYLQNISSMITAAVTIMFDFGAAVIVPGLDFLLPILNPEITEEMLKNNSLEQLRRCDAVFVLGVSPGVKAEIEAAESLGIPVIYDLSGLAAYFETEKAREGKNEEALD